MRLPLAILALVALLLAVPAAGASCHVCVHLPLPDPVPGTLQYLSGLLP